MGGGDLNLKKSWHPLTFKNQEKVWKREHAKEEEQKKLEQLRKELEEERGMQELMDLQDGAAGKGKRKARVDWMYQPGGGSGSAMAREEKEAYLLGTKRVDKLIEQGKETRELDGKAAFETSKGTMYGMTANTYRDTQNKIREDPLLGILKREQSMVQTVLSNPHLVKKMRKKREGMQDDGVRKKAKKDSKDKKKQKKETRHSYTKKGSPIEDKRDIATLDKPPSYR